jgi:hypothetical protein
MPVFLVVGGDFSRLGLPALEVLPESGRKTLLALLVFARHMSHMALALRHRKAG